MKKCVYFVKENWPSFLPLVFLIGTFGLCWYVTYHNLIVIITFDKNGRVTKIENKTPFNVDVSNLKVMIEQHEK